jgi:sortase A
MLSTLSSAGREVSAKDVAARATEAAMRAADAAIKAADAAIKAADAAVRLIDEHEGEVIVLQPAPTSAPGERHYAASGRALPSPDPLGADPFAATPGPARRRSLRVLGVTLIVLGVLALADAGVTLLWQEPVSALYAKLRQDHLSGVLRREERAPPTAPERRALARLSDERARIAYLARALQGHASDGTPVARIRIPPIGLSAVVVRGTSSSALASGPGIYPETVFPGIPGTTAIAGHRTTYLAPFRHIDSLHRGQAIVLDMPYAHFTYTVIGSAVVAPTNVHAAVADVGYPRLVLSACTPLFSAAKRILVYARLASIMPVGAGRLPAARGAPAPISGDALRAPQRPVRPPLPAVLEPPHRDLLSPL